MSIQTLADSLGLSISTVSRALNGYADVSAKTRARVEAAAKAMNYQPDPMAHRLATGRTGAVALVFTAAPGHRQDASLVSLMSGVTEEMRQHKLFTLAVWLPAGDDELPELDRLISARLVDGVVLARPSTLDGRVALLQKRRTPFVTYGRTLENAPHAWVDSDNAGAAAEATAHVIALGHRRIALLAGPDTMTFSVQRQQGFERSVRAAGIAPANCPILHLALTAAAGLDAGTHLLATSPRPTAVLCMTDALALGVCQAAKALGLQVGKDVSVMGFGNSDAAELATPPLATVDHAVAQGGRHVARTLLQVMQNPGTLPGYLLENPTLVLRASVGPYQPG
jgi:LacI family transcriptional regulator